MDEPLTNSTEINFGRMMADARGWVMAHVAEIVCAVLLTVMALQMLFVISRKSITIDEIVMIPSGYYHLATANFDLVYEHPPLSKIVAAVPLLFMQPEEIKPEQVAETSGTDSKRYAFIERFWENNSQRYLSLSFWPRVFMVGLCVALGLLIFRIARDLFGGLAATLAVALFALEPTVLAHGRVVQTDIPAAFGYLLFFFMLRRYTSEHSIKRAIWLGVSIGLAVLTKFSMLLIGPIIVAYFGIQVWKRIKANQNWKQSVVHCLIAGLISIVTINAAYLFQHRRLAPGDVQAIQEMFPTTASMLTPLTNVLSYIVPLEFVLGILRQIWHNGVGHSAGLLGMYSQTGWWYYFPVAFVFKSTIPFLLLSLTAVAWSARQVIKKRDLNHLWVLAPFIVYSIFVLFSRIDIGIRYYLPAYPLLFMMGGALLASILRSRRAGRWGTVGMLFLGIWIGVEAIRAFPNHMSYMNQLAIGKPHWWYLSDSNVEWGDDAPALAAYLRARGETRVRCAFLGDFMVLNKYGVQPLIMANPKGEVPEKTRYAAIGASFLNGSTVPGMMVEGRDATESERVNFFDKYRHKTPEAVFGGSIYLYREDE
jgi:Dolichyl-phosphate-mannose-protein mannosyltransferase